jgi:hypothetical protein
MSMRQGIQGENNLASSYRLPRGVVSEHVFLPSDVDVDDVEGILMSAVFSPTEMWTVVRFSSPESSGLV